MPRADPSTLSNYAKLALASTDVKLKVNWAARTLSGSVRYVFDRVDAAEIVLDTSFLKVSAARVDGKAAQFELAKATPALGAALTVALPAQPAAKTELALDFETTPECTALQWFDPEQTADKKAPYLFSQCQPIHARSLFPCFDTPSVKAPLTLEVESAHPVVAAAVKEDAPEAEARGIYRFRQDIPVPSYLFAIASGALESAPIGPRSAVYCEPSQLAAAKWEFEEDMENFIQVAEKLVLPYAWKRYDLLVLPPSFPFGGMENPNMTFVTPTLVAGDRTLVDVVAHELAHSWSGNLVTNNSWEEMWLNEGWTVYLERRILGALHGEKFRQFEFIQGWRKLEETLKTLGDRADAISPLVIDLTGIDPDDAYSSVPYEKGSAFLYYLEVLLGQAAWDKFIPFYFKKFEGKSLDSLEFKETLYEHFSEPAAKAKLDSIDWKTWLYAPGMPQGMPKFDTTLSAPVDALAERWAAAAASGDFAWASRDDIKDWNNTQLPPFLTALADKLDAQPHVSAAVAKLEELYNVSASKNSEVLLSWFHVAIAGKLESQYHPLAKWLGTNGRMKYTRPGYRLLNKVDRDLALATFKANENGYHPICRGQVRKDLGLA